ncbi:MAG TPA: methyltransferase domain-containing protein [Rhodothermales bacterium]
MTCAQCVGIESEFNEKRARKDVQRLREKGPSRTTRMLLDAIRSIGVKGASLIDIGGGVGAIQLALIDAGVNKVTSVDASRAFLSAARDVARERGVRARVVYVHGDFVEVADRLEPADVVTLDRVICCYDDVDALVESSVSRARRLYGLVYPRDRVLTRLMVGMANAWFRVRGISMRSFVHPTSHVDALIRRSGMEPIFQEETPIWQAVLYARRGV